MDLDAARRVAHAKLRDYVDRHREPAPPISSVYGAEAPPSRQSNASQQERWIERYGDDLAIERVLNTLPEEEYRFVRYHYQERCNVERAADMIPVSRAKGYAMKREILRLIAYALGLTRRETA